MRNIRYWAWFLTALTIGGMLFLLTRSVWHWLLLGAPGVLAGLLIARRVSPSGRWAAIALAGLFLAISIFTAGFLAGYIFLPMAIGLLILSIVNARIAVPPRRRPSQ